MCSALGRRTDLAESRYHLLFKCECAPGRGPGDRAGESQVFISSPPGSTLALGCVREGARGAETKHEGRERGHVDTWTVWGPSDRGCGPS